MNQAPATSLFEAIRQGDEKRVMQALADSPDLVWAADKYRKTALHVAAEHDQDRMAKILLDSGADLEAETSWGMTPLQWAANMGSVKTGALLIARGARLNMWSAAGLGMLEALPAFWDGSGRLKPGAAQQRYDEVEKDRFVKRPPSSDDVSAVSDGFYIACRNGHTDVARYLLGRGADPHFQGFFGGTALHWAAINGHSDTVDYLLSLGARADFPDPTFNSTPAGWAREGGHHDLASRLEA